MKKHRYKVSFSLTTFLYISLFSLYIYFLEQHITVSDADRKEETIELALSQFVPEAPPSQITEPVQEEQLIEEELDPESKKPEEKPEEPIMEEPEPEPEPVLEKKPVAEPVVKKTVTKPVKKTEIKKKRKKRVSKKKHRKKRQVSGGGAPHYSRVQKNSFLAGIRAKINRSKSYPRIAQRRRMQGTVKVRFTILANGNVGNIVITGPKVFHASARKAVRSAFPVDIKKAPLSLPAVVNLSLRYTLHKR